MVYLNARTIGLAYSTTDYAVFSLDTMSATDIVIPAPTAAVTGMCALSGLTGYMTLGLRSKPKPCVNAVNESELLITKDSTCGLPPSIAPYAHIVLDSGYVVSPEAKLSKTELVTFPAPPEETGRRSRNSLYVHSAHLSNVSIC